LVDIFVGIGVFDDGISFLMKSKYNPPRLAIFLAVLAFICSVYFANGGQIRFQDVPIDVAIQNLVRQTGQNYIMSPRLTDDLDADGKPVKKPVITFQGDVTPAELLAKILKENGLVMVDDPVTTVARITFTNEPPRKADASLLAGDTNAPNPIIMLADVPLGDAVRSLAKAANLKVTIDPKLSDPFADGKFVPVPQVSVRWENITARQALLAVAANYDLTITPDKQTGTWRVEKKDRP